MTDEKKKGKKTNKWEKRGNEEGKKERKLEKR
jgi:hypothetical protein